MFFVMEFDQSGRGAYVFQCDTASEGREFLYDLREICPDLSAILCDSTDDRIVIVWENGICVPAR